MNLLKKIYFKLKGFKTFKINHKDGTNQLCEIEGKSYLIMGEESRFCASPNFYMVLKNDDKPHKGFVRKNVFEDLITNGYRSSIHFFLMDFEFKSGYRVGYKEIDPEDIIMIKANYDDLQLTDYNFDFEDYI